MIYCVEDDTSIRELILYTLRGTGFEAQGAESGDDLFAALSSALPQLILLDIMLPGEDGLSVLKKLRNDPRTAGIPVILLTAKGTEYDKVTGLDAGADDYITKPFGMMELVSRIRALLRRTASAESGKILTVGGIALDPRSHQVTVNGSAVPLTLKEFRLLALLMENQGAVLTRDRILEKIWDVSFCGETRTVDVHIRTLRAKLGEEGARVETVRGVGYKIEK